MGTQYELDITRNRHRGADTSVAAFESTPPKRRAKQREEVLKIIKELRGATCEEVSRALDVCYTAASARMSELKRDGLIQDSGKRRPTSHGKAARVMEII